MRKFIQYAMVASIILFAASLVSCGGGKDRKKKRNLPERNENVEDSLAVIGLNAFKITEEVKVNGRIYSYTIERIPLDSTIVIDDEGFRTRDNQLKLSVLKDGTPFFQRTFERSSLHLRVDENYYQQCILLGMNFDRVTDYGLRFVASIGKGADSEDYKPYSITVGFDGSMNITEHDLYDDDEVSRFDDEGV